MERSPATVTDNVLPSSAAESVVLPKGQKRRTQDTATRRLPRPASSRPNQQQNDYADLKRLVMQQGLLDKQLGYYISNTVLRLALLSASLAFLLTVESFWLQLLNAAFLAFAFTQIAFLVHDAGHRQLFNRAASNDLFGLATNLLLGFSRSWWVDTHNQHHINPNDLDLDPHTALPVFAFSEKQARSKRGPLRRLVGYQSFYFLPVLLLEGIGVRTASAQYLLRRKAKDQVAEALLMTLHFVLYFGLLFYVLSVWQALLFIVVHQATLGLYMGLVFAPNHKGMPLLDSESQLDFLRRQAITSRDVSAHPVTDFLYGGLNYQIEHHLFPSMPRNKLREAQKIVRAFCEARSIPYRESSALQSHKEIFQYLHQVSAPLRKSGA